MKSLSVHQPYASWIASGYKTVEARSYRTTHRGPLLICATKIPKHDTYPNGVAICIVNVVDCVQMTHQLSEKARLPNWAYHQWAWILEKPRLVLPIPVTGKQGFFNVDDDMIVKGPERAQSDWTDERIYWSGT